MIKETNLKFIDIFDTEKTRIADFTNGEGQGAIKFEKRSKGNYTYLGKIFDRELSKGVTSYKISIEGEREHHSFFLLSDGVGQVLVRLT